MADFSTARASVEGLSPVKRALLDRRTAAYTGSHAAGRIARQERPTAGAPLSFAQQRLWLLDQLHPGGTAYNVVRAVRLRGELDVAALSAALSVIVDRHEVLRSRIVVVDGEPRMWVDPARPVMLTVEELPAESSEARVQDVLRAEADRHVDLSADPLLRARLLRVRPDEWVLILSTHHIASDETSRSILYAELAEAYAARRGDRPAKLPELPVQYADWAAWQRREIDGPELPALLDWWRRYLRGAPAALQLPASQPMASPRDSGSRFVETLDPELSTALLALARRTGVTLFTALLAGLAGVLGRYGNDDVVVGFPVSRRTAPEVEHLIGYFSDTLVARVAVSGEPSFAELLERSRVAMVGALSHADLPFERLVELAPERSGGSNPLFSVALALESGAESVRRLPGLTVTPIEVAPSSAKFGLALVVAPLADGALRLEWEYDGRRFDRETVARISGHLSTLLGGAVHDPAAAVSGVDILTEREREELLCWGSRPADPAAGQPSTLVERFAANTSRHPERTAVRDRERALSYAELAAASDQLAARLRRAGAGAGALVGVCLGRSSDLVVGLLGVLKAGAAYVPLDPGYPADRTGYVLRNAGCLAMVTTSGVLDRLPPDRPPTILLDDLADTAAPAPLPTPDPTDLAYAIYTSGSTGAPKGVLVEHAALANLLGSMSREPGLGPDDVLVAVTTPAFDIAALELFLPLWVGAEVVVAGEDDTVHPGLLSALLDETGATVLQGTPATWGALVGHGWPGRAGLRAWCGGEALPASLAGEILQRCTELWNLYGPTETTIWSLATRLRAPVADVPIGRPIEATEALVVDRRDSLVPIGVPGELLIGGRGVARGYLGDPELTARRFVSLPVAGGRRVYRTGDLARWRPDGQLEFLGRLDDQVKVRGFRIEPVEVEAALLAEPGVSEAVVVRREDSAGSSRLVAYVTGAGSLDPAHLRGSVSARLPAYMVPSAVVQVPALPRTPNGKLDRSALPAPEGPSAAVAKASPATPVEDLIAGIWCDLLDGPDVGRDDDFFDLGGHSLLLVALAARVRRELGVDLPLAAAYATPTLAGMAAVVSAGLLGEPDPADLDSLLADLEGQPAQ